MGDAAVAQANATLDIVHEIATILDTGLSKEEVAIIIALIENGVNPQERSFLVKFSECDERHRKVQDAKQAVAKPAPSCRPAEALIHPQVRHCVDQNIRAPVSSSWNGCRPWLR